MKNFIHPQKKLEKQRGLFFRIGLAVSLFITFLAFEWETKLTRYEFPDQPIELIDSVMMPITYAKKDKPIPEPKIENKKKVKDFVSDQLKIVTDEKVIVVAIDSIDPNDLVEVKTNPEPVFVEPDFYLIPEEQPEFPGGDIALEKYIRTHTRYPDKARDAGINGTVNVFFIVDENGEVTNVEIARSPNEMLSQEAIRVIGTLPKWKPGKQGGRPVKVRLSVPISFRLK